jgi:redox-sensitive bicupin YhaK (pirin superfamily)
MTAGGGVLHKELHSPDFARRGGRFEVLQLWVNLPAKSKMTPPRYQTLVERDIPVVSLPDRAGSARVIAGQLDGAKGPANTFTPIDLLDVRLTAGRRVELDLREGHSAALYILKGKLVVNGNEPANEGELVVFDRDGNQTATVFVMSGQPIDEPIVGYGPFVMNTEEQIEEAISDMRAGRLGRIPTATRSRIDA